MPLIRHHYPVRAFIRHKARMVILTSYSDPTICPKLDDALLKDLTQTLLQSAQGDPVYAAYASREEAAMVEDAVALELATTYQRIVGQRGDRHIQALNRLLAID